MGRDSATNPILGSYIDPYPALDAEIPPAWPISSPPYPAAVDVPHGVESNIQY